MAYRFGDFVLDTDARTLSRGGQGIPLTPKALVLLSTLIERRPAALSHAELNDLLWPQTFVSQTSLPRVITELRKALDEEGSKPRFLRTVHGFGYAFVGTAVAIQGRGVQARRGGPVLVWGGSTYELPEGETFIGRSTECSIQVASSRVSKRHARVEVVNGVVAVEDLGSRNGTTVNGRSVTAPTRIHDGDTIAIGSAVFVLLEGDPATTTRGDGGV